MVEIFQIAANIIVLGCLAWFVMRETAGKYATSKDIKQVMREIAKQEFSQERYVKDAFDVLRDRISDIEQAGHKYSEIQGQIAGLGNKLNRINGELSASGPITEQEKYIRIGAELMREGVDTGHRVIVDALTRDGRLQRDIEPTKQKGPIIIDEFASEPGKDEESGLPDIIKKMNERLGAELSINGLKGRNNG